MLDNAIPQGFEDAVELRRKNRETVVKYMNPLEIRIDRTLGSDPARLAVVYPSGDQGESRIAADTGFPAVVQVAGTNLHGPLATDRTGLAVVEAGAAQAKSPGPGLGAVDELGGATGNTSPGTDFGAGGELGGSTGTTSPGTDFGAGGELGGSTGTTPPGTDFGADGELGGATGNTPILP